MSETQAASSPVETADVFKGETPTLHEFQQYRESGEVPERFKADTAASQAAEKPEQQQAAPESAPEDDQEPPPEIGNKAKRRFEKLLAENKELQRKLEATAKPDVSSAPSAAQTAPQPAPQQQATRPKPTVDATKPDGTPQFATYEDYVEELADWKAEQRMETAKRQQAEQEAQKALKTQMDDARARYEDAEEVIFPTAEAIGKANIPQVVKQVLEDSDVFVDLCYVIGSDPDELKKFVALAQSNPRAAIGKVFEYENGIKAELAKSGKSSATAPEKKKTQAPAPPSPVGGSAARSFDVNDDSLSADEWFRKRNAQVEKRGS